MTECHHCHPWPTPLCTCERARRDREWCAEQNRLIRESRLRMRVTLCNVGIAGGVAVLLILAAVALSPLHREVYGLSVLPW